MEECLSSTTREELRTVCDRPKLVVVTATWEYTSNSVTDCLVGFAGYARDLADKLRVEQDPVASKVLELRLEESEQWLGSFKVLLKRLFKSKRRMS